MTPAPNLTRRALLGGAAALAGTTAFGQAPTIADYAGLSRLFHVPDWFRDAKFGIWAHWGPQCVPEAGDWYGRLMYVQGQPAYDHHVRTYGHPADTGFLDLIGRWRAEAWRPEEMIARYKRAGARYFVSMANHHDNFDNFASRHHAWNSTRVGPRRDIVGTWARAARAAGLKFGVSNHSSHAWHWWQTAYGYDSEGARRGQRYDAYRLRAADGRGHFWDGLDPQDLYTGPHFVPPDGIESKAALDAWHGARDGQWLEDAPPAPAAFADNWLARQMDLVDQHRPDLVYFDDTGLPFGAVGRAAALHYYRRHPGGVLTAKHLTDVQQGALVEDVERGFVDGLRDRPWQTCTCIGGWHYDRGLYARHGYKGAKLVLQRLADIVAKNGNLLLSIPVRADGSLDELEIAILDDLARWFAVNGAAIHDTRPWRSFGEGPTRPPAGVMNENEAAPFTARDVRYTHGKDGAVYAILLDWPADEVRLTALAGQAVQRVEWLGHGPLDHQAGADGLRVRLPPAPADALLPVLKLG